MLGNSRRRAITVSLLRICGKMVVTLELEIRTELADISQNQREYHDG
jgi:hypothetical protein